jgi:protein gp37
LVVEIDMAVTSKIEWTDSTFNPWIGCTKISPACDHCYAAAMNKAYGWVGAWGGPGVHGSLKRTSPTTWQGPRRWQRQATSFQAEHGRRQRVFCASLSDVFDNQAPQGWRDDLFALIRACPDLDWQILTKRPQNIARMLPADWGNGYENIWLGVTAEDQHYFDQRWPILRQIPAKIRFLSYEPALGPLRITPELRPDWIIVGGESGGSARTMNPQWARDLRTDCRDLDVPFFLKQWGTYHSNPLVAEEGMTLKEAKQLDPKKNGKGGGLLDDHLYREFPRGTDPNQLPRYLISRGPGIKMVGQLSSLQDARWWRDFYAGFKPSVTYRIIDNLAGCIVPDR